MSRTIALIDGYNFYHPIKDAQTRQKRCLQWLNYRSLLDFYLSQDRRLKGCKLTNIYFFTALATHRDKQFPGTTERHLKYINALKSEGAQVIFGNFKKKKRQFSYKCDNSKLEKKCQIIQRNHEEKETDVRIAVSLFELAMTNAFDTCLLLSADSDLVPAVEMIRKHFPDKRMVLVSPPSSACIDKLKSLCRDPKTNEPIHISVKADVIARHQFPDVIDVGDGYSIENPWLGNFPQALLEETSHSIPKEG